MDRLKHGNLIFTTKRLLALDVFRGLTVFLMVIVNSGSPSTSYSWLCHVQWDGCSLADLVFPFFIFIVGVSTVFSLSNQQAQGISQRDIVWNVCKRALILFALGLALNAFPWSLSSATIRWMGVLQRIAICYLIAAGLFLTTRMRTQIFIIVWILIGYWLIMTQISVPYYGVNHLTPEGNFASFVDRLVIGSSHMYRRHFDPEGLFCTFPAIATALLGNVTGMWLMASKKSRQVSRVLIPAGIVMALCGWSWGCFFPINKALWSSSFVLLSGGLALSMLGLCYYLLDVKQYRTWAIPFQIFGTNALAVYVLHVLGLKIQMIIGIILSNNTIEDVRSFISQNLFAWFSPENASLLYSVSYATVWLMILGYVDRKRYSFSQANAI